MARWMTSVSRLFRILERRKERVRDEDIREEEDVKVEGGRGGKHQWREEGA